MVKEHKCPRVIRPNEYERQNKVTFNWWCRLFYMMEYDYSIPPYKQKEVITKIFPEEVLQKILSLITMAEVQTPKDFQLQSTESLVGLVRRSSISAASTRKLFSSSEVPEEKIRTEVKKLEEEAEKTKEATEKHLPAKEREEAKALHKRSWMLQKKRHEVGAANPYLKFFKGDPERVAIWRELPPLCLETMNLSQKAEAITEAIAIDFINWIKKIGGDSTTTLDVPQVMKMFEIGFNTHAATSLAARIKEMPAVTKQIADVRQLPNKAIRAKLHEKLRDDLRAFKIKKKMFAFGTALPVEMRYNPPKEDVTAKWTQTRTSERLQDMSAVWEGITHLRSTRGFCRWLMEHPEIPAPKYLEDQGMLTASFFEIPHYSIETQVSGGSLEIKHGSAADLLQNRMK